MNPTASIYLCNKVGMDPSVFENYVANANEILDEFGVADGKGLFNRLLTLGGTKSWLEEDKDGMKLNVIPDKYKQFVKDFRCATRALNIELIKELPLVFEIIKEHGKANPKKDSQGNLRPPYLEASFQALVLNHIEDKMLCEIVAASWDLGGKVYDLFFDGFGNNLTNQQLAQANNVVRGAFGVNITYRNKPFPPPLDPPEDLRRPKPARERKLNPYQTCNIILQTYAQSNGLLKANNRIYEPVPGFPCGFTRAKYKSYMDFVGQVLKHEPMYTNVQANMPSLLVTWTENTTDDLFPFYVVVELPYIEGYI